MNPFDGLARYFLGRIQQRVYQDWMRMLFQMGFSGMVTFLFVCGGTLVKTGSWTASIGGGMVFSAVIMVAFFRRSPQTAGMIALLPQEEAIKEINLDIQTIQRAEAKK
jgi:uncharacterized membrane protein YjjP (DUF1212 family)